MQKWEIFEERCTDYLNKTFGKYATFRHKGGSDSTTPDILATTANGASFYIEAKQGSAQCGQFVLLPDITKTQFIYSPRNITPINPYSEIIMAHMNKHFEHFKNAGTKGEKITFPNDKDIFAKWVISTYRQKNVRFFITDNNTLIPLEQFDQYFDISATYRIKRSGSRSAGKGNASIIVKHLQDGSYTIEKYRDSNSKLFIHSSDDLNHETFKIAGNEYMFSQRDNEYEIRKLSNTFNANVIFSIKLKPNMSGLAKAGFIKYLEALSN